MPSVQTLYLWGAVTVTQRDTLLAAMSSEADVHGGYGYEPSGELAGSIRLSSITRCDIYDCIHSVNASRYVPIWAVPAHCLLNASELITAVTESVLSAHG